MDVVDLSGLTLAPGFIDIHTHHDAQVTWDPELSPLVPSTYPGALVRSRAGHG